MMPEKLSDGEGIKGIVSEEEVELSKELVRAHQYTNPNSLITCGPVKNSV
jgi:hypothetical protein